MDDSLERIKQANLLKVEKAVENAKHNDLVLSNMRTQEVLLKSFASLVDFLDKKTTRTEIVNQLEEIGTPDALKVVEAVNSLHDTLKTHENTDLSGVTKVLQDLLKETKQIPKQLPEIPKTEIPDNSKHLDNLLKAVQSLEKVVKSQELKVEAPVVNVPETKVNVDAPDLKPIEDSVKASSKELVKAVKSLIIPDYSEHNKEVEKQLKKLNKLIDEFLDAPSGGAGGGGGIASFTNSSGVVTQVQLTSSGAVPVEQYGSSTVLFAPINVSSSGDNTVVAGVTSKKIKVLSVVLVAAGAVSVKWRSGTTDLSGAMPLAANSGFVLPSASPVGRYFETASGQALNINLSGAVQVSGHISYFTE